MLAVLAVTLFCSQSSEIVSDRFLATLGRAFAGKPMVTYRKKSWTHPTGEGDLWLHSSPFSGSSQGPRDALPSAAGPCMSPEWLHPGPSPSGWEESTDANNLPVPPGPATPLHQLKPRPYQPCTHQKEYWRFGPFCWCTPASISTTHCSELAGVSLREESTSNAARIPSRLLKREDWTDFCTRQTPHVKKIGGSVLNISLWKFNQIMRSFELEGICKDHLTQFRCDEQG